MSACAHPSADAAVINLTLAGTGEPLLRMEKRLSCAASGLGIRLIIDIRKDADALGIPYSQTPAVLYGGQVIFNGLPRTEEIEVWLKNLFQTRERVMKNIKVLGTGCANCKTTMKLIEAAAREKGVEIQLEKIEEIQDIMAYGVISTPGVVVDGKVVHAGGVPTRDKIAGWL